MRVRCGQFQVELLSFNLDQAARRRAPCETQCTRVLRDILTMTATHSLKKGGFDFAHSTTHSSFQVAVSPLEKQLREVRGQNIPPPIAVKALTQDRGRFFSSPLDVETP